MDWDVQYRGRGQLTGREAVMSLTQSAMSARTNSDPHTAYSMPRGPCPGSLPSGWLRYAHRTKVKGNPELEFLLIMFELAQPGCYVFKPPVLTVIHPDGTRRPFLPRSGAERPVEGSPMQRHLVLMERAQPCAIP